MTHTYSQAARQAQDYYNSDDADRFYATLWGGTEDLHVGMFAAPDEPIERANRRTVEQMAALVDALGPELRVIDLGSGYGGTARFLARSYGAATICLNISERQNELNRRINHEQGLDHLIDVLDGSYEAIPLAEASVDLAWSQDAMLHSDNHQQILAEAYRVLKPGGRFIFTDPMQADDAPKEILAPIYARVDLKSLGSVSAYLQAAQTVGFRTSHFHDHSAHLATTYRRIYADLQARYAQLVSEVSPAYLDQMLTGLRHWYTGGEAGYLHWGIFDLTK
ncbi:SAM-dependent methyltransferase [Candidatus Viridilinea mediisalina]|uniref:SAM-dependent methyltransferase n=1 Tax=Candidatus Viridilinea mediisalina TaxID=2024553 RepID=A0A2A6RKD5_9CHLR|nr:class I SAM-dependent methyltransferase [Candidatus Viridilinea mediisalina]PDW03365.1 SAM-dependent methyltransferase [Candidatus Viridilinea mediisalina]